MLATPGTARDDPTARAWGFWATLGFSAVISTVVLFLQIATGILFLALAGTGHAGASPEELSEDLRTNGLLLSVATCVTASAGTVLTFAFARLRRKISIVTYLALKPVSRSVILRCSAIMLVFAVGSDLLTHSLGRPIVPEFVKGAYETAQMPPLLWFALIVAGPVFEEVFFRGFLYRGLAESKLGPPGAILFTSAVWAGIHLQYDAYGMAGIFVAGLILGWARERTGSLVPPLAMHSLMNLLATVEAAFLP